VRQVGPLDAAPVPAAQEERRLATGAVMGEQLVVLGATVHHDGSGSQGHQEPAVDAVSSPSAVVSRSGARLNVPICGSCPASSRSASASSVEVFRSR
jgi:hypothetical protein